MQTELTKIILTDKDLIEWNKKPLINNYQRINNFLVANLGIGYDNLLATPAITVFSPRSIEVIWYSIGEESLNRVLNTLPESEYQIQKNAFSNTIQAIKELIQNNKNNNDENNWSKVLELVFSNINEEQIIVEKNKFCIINWGIRPQQDIDTNTSLSNSKPIGINALNNISEGAIATSNNLPIPEDSINPVESVDNLGDKTFNNYTENQPPLTADSSKVISKKYKWLYLLFGIIVLLIIAYLVKEMLMDHKIPETPRTIVPIDSSAIELSKDSLGYVAKDRLNIVAVGKSNKIEKLIADVQSIFPSKEYQVIYYDTLTRRIQIQLPSNERVAFKEKLKSQSWGYKILVFEERIYKNNFIPNDPNFDNSIKSWHLDVIRAIEAWDVTLGNNDVTIAIIDDGFDLNHAELHQNIIRPYNSIEHSANVFTFRGSEHGTHVAGLSIGKENNGMGAAGVSPHCKFMPIQASDRNGILSSTAIIDGILYAIENGASVINLSLGEMINPLIKYLPESIQRDIIAQTRLDEELFWDDIFQIAAEHNVTIVMAAGNDDMLIGIDPMQRNPLGIKVNAISPSLTKANFSNYGDYSTVSAPGVNIVSSIPYNRFKSMDGTSMASPLVAGAVTLLKSIDKDLDTPKIIEILQKTGIPIQSTDQIGNLIQLDKAIEYLKNSNNNYSDFECNNIQLKINSLYLEIERLKTLCPNAVNQDTLKIPSKISTTEFLEGKWRSTTSIHNNSGDEVIIYFNFDNKNGNYLLFAEKNNKECDAPIKVGLKSNSFEIIQNTGALCSDGKYYNAYAFHCQADPNGYAECTAQNKVVWVNKFNFKLVKIQ